MILVLNKESMYGIDLIKVQFNMYVSSTESNVFFNLYDNETIQKVNSIVL